MFLAYSVRTRPLCLAFILYFVASGEWGMGEGVITSLLPQCFHSGSQKLVSKNIWSFCTWLLCVMNSIFRYKRYI